MGKKNKPQSKGEQPDAEPAQPFNAAFAGLGSLRDALPAGDAEPEPASEAPEATAEADGQAWLRRKLVVRQERKGRGGKTVTLLEAAFDTAEQRSAIASELGRALGCAARVEGEAVVLGGDQRSRVATWLEARGARRVVVGN